MSALEKMKAQRDEARDLCKDAYSSLADMLDHEDAGSEAFDEDRNTRDALEAAFKKWNEE